VAETIRYTIAKQFEFCASHQLRGLIGTTLPGTDQEHPCSRKHGHNYVVEVVLSGTTLDSQGFLVDYHDLAPVKKMLDYRFDHRDLNEVLQVDNPTAEVLARRIFRWCRLRWPALIAEVTVKETPKTSATVRFDEPDPRYLTLDQAILMMRASVGQD
jgi:6-pyruvoyltetrahydropterin/6-carboxytetrahydropterin synthase